MAGTLNVTCDKCKKVMKVPEVLAGKRIRCQGCQATLAVNKPAPPKQAAPSNLKPGEVYESATAYGIQPLDEQLRCAFCANDMEDGQIVCLKCGYNMQTRERHGTKVVHIQTGGDYFLWHLPAVLCAILALFCIGSIVVVWTETPDLGEFGEYVQKWRWGAVYSTAFLLFILYLCSRFALKRFIYEPHPPELEKHAHEAHRDDDE